MGTVTEIKVPDIGDFENVEVIEVLVTPGGRIGEGDSIVTLESDKATLEIPSPLAGVVREIAVAVGDKVSEGSPILTLDTASMEQAANGRSASREASPATVAAPPPPDAERETVIPRPPAASPAIRRLGRELGVDPGRAVATGPKGRLLPEDVQRLARGGGRGETAPAEIAASKIAATESAAAPVIDFSAFGPVETQSLSRIQRLSGPNLHRTWQSVPHVTHHDLADVTDLDAFRRQLRAEEKRVTLPAFLLKAAVAALRAFPTFNASLAPDGENLILKRYYHIGVAVDTPEGLVVPVIRDVDRKGILELAEEIATLGARARDKRLAPGDLQGGCFTISSLGGIGGTGFTPILNAPEVAILGAARASVQPVYLDGEFRPRLMLPLSLAYDHRVIDGAKGARFMALLCSLLGDARRLLL